MELMHRHQLQRLLRQAPHNTRLACVSFPRGAVACGRARGVLLWVCLIFLLRDLNLLGANEASKNTGKGRLRNYHLKHGGRVGQRGDSKRQAASGDDAEATFQRAPPNKAV